MTRNYDFRDVLSMKEFGCMLAELLLLFLSSFESAMLPRLCGPLGLLYVSVEQLAQLAARFFTPMRQAHAVSRALMCVGGEALTVAHLRRTLTHVHLAEVEVFVWIHAAVAVAEEILLFQLVTLGEDLLLAVETVLRSLRVLVWLSSASSQSTHAPAVSKLPHLIL